MLTELVDPLKMSINANNSHNSIMVKDRHTHALKIMLNMKLNDSCIDFAAETKQCSCLVQFLGEEVIPSNARSSLSACHPLLVPASDDEKVTKDKVTNF